MSLSEPVSVATTTNSSPGVMELSSSLVFSSGMGQRSPLASRVLSAIISIYHYVSYSNQAGIMPLVLLYCITRVGNTPENLPAAALSNGQHVFPALSDICSTSYKANTPARAP